jgi:hypothetical protein
MPLAQLLLAGGFAVMLILVTVEIRRHWHHGRGAKGPSCEEEAGSWEGVDGGEGEG